MTADQLKIEATIARASKLLKLQTPSYTYIAQNLRMLGFGESEVIALVAGKKFGNLKYRWCHCCLNYKYTHLFKNRKNVACNACLRYRINYDQKLSIL